jgi:L-threonylcarbamoyladenylate synthase
MITQNINKAITELIQDNVVAIPTETVYGLAGNAFSELAVNKIFSLKKRPLHNPLIVHISSINDLKTIAINIPDKAMKLARKFWPGSLTLILDKHPDIPYIVTAGNEKVAVRVPNHPLTLELLNQLTFPLAAPSANPFGSISPTSAQHVLDYFSDQLEVILDGGPCENGIESTIVGFENNEPIVYRLGALTIEEIENEVGPVKFNVKNDQSPIAPGMLSRHYAPNTETFLTNNIKSLIKTFPDKKIGVLVFSKPINDSQIIHTEILSNQGKLEEAAKNLYAALHRLDERNLDIIIAEIMPDIGIGKAMNDRLQRAIKKN